MEKEKDLYEYLDEELAHVCELHDHLLDYLDNENNNNFFPDILTMNFDINNHSKRDGLMKLLRILIVISNNYHRKAHFYQKIEQILRYFKNEIKQIFFNEDLYDFFKRNKRMLLFFFEENILILNKNIIIDLNDSNLLYFAPEIKNFLQTTQSFNSKTDKIYDVLQNVQNFEAKRHEGENEDYICQLIRNDSVEEFIVYVNRYNISLLTKVKPSIFETNEYLLNENPTLIEYSVFFGSIQIFQYIKFNNVELTPSLWIYAIHGRNPEIIHILEENHILPPEKSFINCFIESIKCHHNELAHYFQDNYLDENEFEQLENNQQYCLIDYIFKFHNFEFVNDNPNHHLLFCYLCKHNFTKAVNILIDNKSLQIAVKELNIDIIYTLLLNYEKSIPKELFLYCRKLKEFSIPNSITSIEDSSFAGCSELIKIIIPPSVTYIGKKAFQYCNSLTEIILPNSITSIANETFSRCSSLQKIVIPSSVISIGNSVFSCCNSLTEIFISQSVTSIGDYAFASCSALTQIELPSSINKIANGLFWCCTSLVKVTIPPNVIEFGNEAFLGCNLLTDISIPLSLRGLGFATFAMCFSITEISIPPSVDYIFSRAFSQCKSLTKIIIPSSIIRIDDYAFNECSSLASIKLPPSITSINNNVFEQCSSLISIIIPQNVVYIGNFSFANCSSLKQISIPSGVQKIGHYAFQGCSSLTTISIPFLTIIKQNTFQDCISLTRVLIPASVVKIKKSAFAGCSSLKQVLFDDNSSLKIIGDYAFSKCTRLIQISIPSSADTVSENAFQECSLLLQIKISLAAKRRCTFKNLFDQSNKK